MNVNKNIFGIICILIAMALFSVHDAILKYIFEKTSLYEIFFARTLIAAFLSFVAFAIAPDDYTNLYLGVLLLIVVVATSYETFSQEAKSENYL